QWLNHGAAVLILTLAWRFPAQAQQASISGLVTASQAPLPEVTVTLRSAATQARSTATDEQGRFTFQSLNAGSYDLSFTREGFESVTRTVSVSTNSASLEIELRLGALSTRVEVTDVAGKATASRIDVPDRELPVQVSSVSDQVLQAQGANDLISA